MKFRIYFHLKRGLWTTKQKFSSFSPLSRWDVSDRWRSPNSWISFPLKVVVILSLVLLLQPHVSLLFINKRGDTTLPKICWSGMTCGVVTLLIQAVIWTNVKPRYFNFFRWAHCEMQFVFHTISVTLNVDSAQRQKECVTVSANKFVFKKQTFFLPDRRRSCIPVCPGTQHNISYPELAYWKRYSQYGASLPLLSSCVLWTLYSVLLWWRKGSVLKRSWRVRIIERPEQLQTLTVIAMMSTWPPCNLNLATFWTN